MVPGRVRIDSLEAAQAAVLAAGQEAQPILVVPVVEAVPEWLAALVVTADDAGATVVIEAEPPAHLEGEALDGWEIGVCTAAIAAGAADVRGIDPQRVARVREVDASLRAAAARPAPEPAS